MPRPCSICNHPRANEINRELASGESDEGIARGFAGISADAVRRHRINNHIPKKLTKATEVREVTQANTILQQVVDLKKEFKALMKSAKKDGDRDSFIKAGREVFRGIELLAKIAGELNDNGKIQTNVQVNIALQSAEREILLAFVDERFGPGDREALAARLANIPVPEAS